MTAPLATLRDEEREAREAQRKSERMSKAKREKRERQAWAELKLYKRGHPRCTCDIRKGEPLPERSCCESLRHPYICPVLVKARALGL